jgi:Xaa-Pro aminopeptidase
VRRLQRLRAELDGLGASTFLVSNPTNVRYLSGFRSSNAALLAGADRVFLLTDGRYLDAARELSDVEVVEAARDLNAFLGQELGGLAEPPVAFEAGFVTVAARDAIAQSGVELVPSLGVVERLRAVKDEGELDAIRRAAAITNRAYERLAGERVVGTTEAELAWRLGDVLHEEGADDLAFPAIVASGPNSARPHHHPGERVVEAGETLIVDMGAALGGYASDCTRTFATGELPRELVGAYELCREAQATALEAVRPGAAARDVDAVARTRIAEAGHEVLHGLGHAVGLVVHEEPRLSDTADGTLAAGNVVTVEPGVYLPGRGGVRIEDLVVVTDDGPEILTSYTKELVTLR